MSRAEAVARWCGGAGRSSCRWLGVVLVDRHRSARESAPKSAAPAHRTRLAWQAGAKALAAFTFSFVCRRPAEPEVMGSRGRSRWGIGLKRRVAAALRDSERRPPTPPNSRRGLYIYISSPPRLPRSHSFDTLVAARERCLAARDRAHDSDMRSFWLQCARHFQMQLGDFTPWEPLPSPAT